MKVVIRFQDDTVVAFDAHGRRMRRYRGRYQEVRERVLRDATGSVVFAHGFMDIRGIQNVPRDEW